MHLTQKLRAVTKKFFAEVILDDLARGKIDIKSLPTQMRRYVISCLVITYIILICITIMYFYNNLIPDITFLYNGTLYNISYITITVSLITFVLGWTFLLMGGVWSNIVIFSILSIFFIYFTGYIGLVFNNSVCILLLLGFTTALSVLSFKSSMRISAIPRYLSLISLCFIIAFLLVYTKPIRHFIKHDYIIWAIFILAAFLVFLISGLGYLKKWQFPEKRLVYIGRIISICILIIFLSIFLMKSFQISQFTECLFTVFERILAYISIFWFVLGFTALWFVVNLSEWTRDALSILFPKKVIFTIVFTFWALIILLNIYPLELHYTWGFALKWTNLAILLFIILLIKRFNVSKILTFFQFTIFVLLLTHGYYDMNSQTIQDVEFGWFSFIIFIVGITWLLFQGSGFIINSSGRWFPRNSRLFLFFGIILLMLGLSNIMLITRYKTFMNEVKLSSFMGFVYTGPPFILYLWLVKRFKRHPVRPAQLAYLFIFGAIIAHFYLILQKILFIYGAPIILLFAILSLILEYAYLYIIRFITYESPSFNELIDGVIYASSIGLGWLIFSLNPQFSLFIIPIKFVSDIGPAPINSAFLWYMFSLEFACAGLLGYGLAKAKLAGIPYRRANIFSCKQIFLGWMLAIIYRSIMYTIPNIHYKRPLSPIIIWLLISISLVIAVTILWRVLRQPKRTD